MFFVKDIDMKMVKIILLLFLFGIGNNVVYGYEYLGDQDIESKTVVYPNPATDGYISIETVKEITQIEILNIVGQRILTYGAESVSSVRLDIGDLNAGIYLLKLSFSDNTNDTKRIWVK